LKTYNRLRRASDTTQCSAAQPGVVKRVSPAIDCPSSANALLTAPRYLLEGSM
jgi:hypothetical protein